MTGDPRAIRFVEDLRDVTETAVLVVAAHPDDEVIGTGGQWAHWPGLSVLHITDGAPRRPRDDFPSREAYAAVRRREAEAALAVAGLGADRLAGLGLADQEASLDLAGLARRLADELRRRHPEIVITHPYEGGHPDHDAAAFAVHAACRLLEQDGTAPPAIVEMTSYHGCDGRLVVLEFLPGGADCPVTTVTLTDVERAVKRRMLDCHATQRYVLAAFPTGEERFRPAPPYDFTRPPHPGQLYYEQFDWGVTGEQWRDRARVALAALGLAGPV